MKVIIITDMEGVSGIDNVEVWDENSDAYQKGRYLLMEDVNAAVEGAFDGGATEVTVIDGHHTGDNFVKENLHPRAKQMSAFDFRPATPQKGDYDALICVGCHAMAGTETAFLDHTMSSVEWFEYRIGQKCYGEIGIQAIWAGNFGFPLVAVSGDEKACEEAKALIPNVAVAPVKKGIYRNQAVSVDLDEAHKRIFDAASDGVRRASEIKPYIIPLPTQAQLTFTRSDFCDRQAAATTVCTRCGRTLTKPLDAITCYDDLVVF